MTTAEAQPHLPESDATVLVRLPASEATRALAPLRQALQRDPRDLHTARELARAYIEIARRTSDPRFVSYAQAVLAPWMQQHTPPAAVLVLQATALQNQHHFSAALEVLERALALEPNDAQAWLTKATLLQVQGNFDAARTACQRVLRTADQRVGLTCLLSVDSLSGSLERSYAALQRAAALPGPARDDATGWIEGHLAEMAVRLGDLASAARHFDAALKSAPEDVYLRAAYADLLLIEGRNTAVIQLLGDGAAHDVLLLRLAIAGRRAHDRQARQWASMFDARRRATRADDNPHLREHARFLLDVLDRPQEALELARKNWTVQREPADVRIYARAAHAADSRDDTRVIDEWIAHTRFEDRTLHVPSLRARR